MGSTGEEEEERTRKQKQYRLEQRLTYRSTHYSVYWATSSPIPKQRGA